MFYKTIERVLNAGLRYARVKAYSPWNQRKPDNRQLSTAYLISRLNEEVCELEEAYQKMLVAERDRKGSEKDRCLEAIEIAMEAGDVINFASMICDNIEFGNFK